MDRSESAMKQLVDAAHDSTRAGRWDDALSGYETALAGAAQWAGAGEVADIARRIGSIQAARGEIELAAELFELSRTIAELNDLPAQVASAMLGLASVAQSRGDLDGSEQLYLRAGALAEAAGDLRTAAMAEQNRGILANIRGDVAEAISRYESALARHQALGDHRMSAFTLNNMGMAHVDLGQLKAADRSFRDALDLAERSGDKRVLGMVSLNRAELLLKRREFAEARESCDFAVEIFNHLGATPSLAEAHKFYGILYRETGKSHLADIHFAEAIELAQRCEDRLLEGEAESERALLFLGLGRNADALQGLNRSHRILSGLQARREIADLDQRLDQLEATFVLAMKAWAETIESKDLYTAGHCERVADLGCMLAEAVGVTGRELAWFRMGAILHDVGKISVPAEILNKPGRLSPEERQIMQGHAVVGDEIVAKLEFPWNIRPLVRSHHEHWVGTGYPDGLAGEEIPLHARILCVADVFDALTSARAYKPALPLEEALAIMEEDCGRMFEPRLFTLFASLVRASAPKDPAPAKVAAGIHP
jgi:putative nucleotidyltransferase with HDIG domain